METPRLFHHRHISSGGIVYRLGRLSEPEILLLYRRASNSWHLPKGTRMEGERLIETATREVKEETGAVVRIHCYLGSIKSQFHRGEHLVPSGPITI